MDKKIAQIDLGRYSNRQKVFRSIISTWKHGLQEGERLLLVFDKHNPIKANSPVKGHRRTPINPFIQELLNDPDIDVLFIDEYRTSRVCSNCYMFGRWHKRSFICSHCGKIFDRDVNAARNIGYLGMCILRGERKRPIFRRRRPQL